MELFSRKCIVLNQRGDKADLLVRFYAPEYDPDYKDYKAISNISCKFFQKNVYAIGSDAAQAFFALPMATTAYLIGQRRYGYETYWVEKGDLDYKDFWTYAS